MGNLPLGLCFQTLQGGDDTVSHHRPGPNSCPETQRPSALIEQPEPYVWPYVSKPYGGRMTNLPGESTGAGANLGAAEAVGGQVLSDHVQHDGQNFTLEAPCNGICRVQVLVLRMLHDRHVWVLRMQIHVKACMQSL